MEKFKNNGWFSIRAVDKVSVKALAAKCGSESGLCGILFDGAE